MRKVSAVFWILPRGSRASGFASASAAWLDEIHLPSAKRLIETLLAVRINNCEPESSKTVARRCSREEIRAASCAAASCIDCASTRQGRTDHNNSPNTTRLIRHIILFACNHLDDELQQGEGQHQRARKAESQHDGDLRKVAEEREYAHCPAPTVPPVLFSTAFSPNAFVMSSLTSCARSTSSPTWTSSNNSSTS